ncbi:MAG: transposase [Kofleriaceae bacterium]|nr:transposase [Kofleriaceae bacterium]
MDGKEGKTHGGRREGAGRKKTNVRRGGPHRRRPALSAHHPVHVVLRLRRWLPDLRAGRFYRALRPVLALFLGRADFRIVHLSIQNNHLHLLVEAADRDALGRNMQSFAINAARAINRARRASGKVFAFRYHATQITTPRQARRSLAYVLNNWRHHQQDLATGRVVNGYIQTAMLDEYSTAISFTGWIGRPRWTCPEGYEPLPVSPPSTDLLARSWERLGLIDPFEVPGPLGR